MAIKPMISIEPVGLTEALTRVNGFEAAFANMKAPLSILAKELKKDIRSTFSKSTSLDGKRFAPISPQTVLNRKKRGLRETKRASRLSRYERAQKAATKLKPMLDTGALRGSVSIKVSARSFEISMLRKVLPHISGGKGLPQRNVTPFIKTRGSVRLMPRYIKRAGELLVEHIVTDKKKPRGKRSRDGS